MAQAPRALDSGASWSPGPPGPRESAEPSGSEYAMLSKRVRQAGLLDRRLRYYSWKIGLTGLALAAGWTGIIAIFFLAMWYNVFYQFPSLAYLYWYFAGLICARRVALSIKASVPFSAVRKLPATS